MADNISVYVDALDNDAKFRLIDLNEKAHTVPKTEKEKKLAAMGHPKDKITHKDILIGRGVLSREEAERIAEKVEVLEDTHYCAKHVFSERFGEGVVVEGAHAEPDENGLIEWYDVDFGGIVRRVMTEKVKVMHAEYHMNHKRKKMSEEDKTHTVPKTAKEKDLAAAAEPKDKITHKDVLVKRGVVNQAEEVQIEEANGGPLTPEDFNKDDKLGHEHYKEYTKHMMRNPRSTHVSFIRGESVYGRPGPAGAKKLADAITAAHKRYTGVKEEVEDVAEAKADPTSTWVVYDGNKVERFKTHQGAKAYAEQHGGKVASSAYYADKIQGKKDVAEGLEQLTEKRVEISKDEYDKLKQQHADQQKKSPYGNHANSSYVYKDTEGNVVNQTYAHHSHKHLTSIERTPKTGKYHKIIREEAKQGVAEEVELDEAMHSPFRKAALALRNKSFDPKNSSDDRAAYSLHADLLASKDPKHHEASAKMMSRHDTYMRDQISDAVHQSSSKENSAKYHKMGGVKRLK